MAFVQLAAFIILEMSTETAAAADVEAALVLCALYISVSIPALPSVILIHLLSVAFDTGL